MFYKRCACKYPKQESTITKSDIVVEISVVVWACVGGRCDLFWQASGGRTVSEGRGAVWIELNVSGMVIQDFESFDGVREMVLN